jgi:hypothetical protein
MPKATYVMLPCGGRRKGNGHSVPITSYAIYGHCKTARAISTSYLPYQYEVHWFRKYVFSEPDS